MSKIPKNIKKIMKNTEKILMHPPSSKTSNKIQINYPKSKLISQNYIKIPVNVNLQIFLKIHQILKLILLAGSRMQNHQGQQAISLLIECWFYFEDWFYFPQIYSVIILWIYLEKTINLRKVFSNISHDTLGYISSE